MLNLVDCLFVTVLGLVGGGPITARRRDGRAIGGFQVSTGSSRPVSRTSVLLISARVPRDGFSFQKAVTQRANRAQ